jgi:A/G-specific adenine glycosylase
VLLRRCGAGERWAGLWDFPRFRVEGEGPLFVSDELVAGVREQTGVTVKPGALVKTIKHCVTRYRITLECYEALPISGRVRSTAGRVSRWTPTVELTELPLSVTGRRIAGLFAARRDRPSPAR